jgi:hypothetical protein
MVNSLNMRIEKQWSARSRSALAVVVASLFSFAPAGVSQQRVVANDGTSFKYDTPGIRLEGLLLERKVFGPPGYGETPAKDTRETILVLKLSHPIDVAPAADAEANNSASLDSVKDINEVQLFVDPSRRAETRKWIGRRIIVTGTLEESITASQYMKIFLDVEMLDSKP